ncbi:hypothetical protein HanXRQr2_Chr13g0574751 [Helianthus annuus]|uniref:Uncharacterized protein n=1 Tax=Helianthus annuus TaxID=4232 RepID=A0A9K3EEU4_HELAN|nr:hypothetical protein HanXRQr2_Chr13g0574751 [Helianthus annuus]KAJ0848108.1 hypothetical protein HanPSC8_Chr13g0553281 [Helianthus annuus]
MSAGMQMYVPSVDGCVPSPTRNRKSENHGSLIALIFVVNRIFLVNTQRGDIRRLASTICARVPRLTTGSTCLKSPPITIVFPPNGRGMPVMSCKVRSTASIDCRFAMEASSQMISFDELIRRATPLCFFKLHMELLHRFIGILNLECAVLPPGMLFAATPDEAVASAIRPRERTSASNALYKNVFPVPPGPSMKNTAGTPCVT